MHHLHGHLGLAQYSTETLLAIWDKILYFLLGHDIYKLGQRTILPNWDKI